MSAKQKVTREGSKPKAVKPNSAKSVDSAARTSGFAFSKQNYRLLLIGLALIFVGFMPYGFSSAM